MKNNNHYTNIHYIFYSYSSIISLTPHYSSINKGASHSISTWNFIGPFSVGKTEIDGIHLYGYFKTGALGNEIQIGNNSQLIEKQVISEHVKHGQMYWSKISVSRQGYATLSPQTYNRKVNVDLNSLVQSTSSITIQESQGWIYTHIHGGTNDYNKSFRLHCIGLRWMDNKHYYHGDIYSSNHILLISYGKR